MIGNEREAVERRGSILEGVEDQEEQRLYVKDLQEKAVGLGVLWQKIMIRREVEVFQVSRRVHRCRPEVQREGGGQEKMGKKTHLLTQTSAIHPPNPSKTCHTTFQVPSDVLGVARARGSECGE